MVKSITYISIGLDSASKPVRKLIGTVAKNTGKVIEKTAKFSWKLVKKGWNALVWLDYNISVTVDDWLEYLELVLGKLISPVWKVVKSVGKTIGNWIRKLFNTVDNAMDKLFDFSVKVIKNLFKYLVAKPARAFYDHIFHPLDVAAYKLLSYIAKKVISPIFRGIYRFSRTYILNPIGRAIKFVAKKLYEVGKIVIWKPFVWIMKKVVFKVLDWVIGYPMRKLWALLKIPVKYVIQFYKKQFASGLPL